MVMAASDHRDLALEDLARAEIDALADVVTWREIARAAIANLHEQHREIARLRLDQARLLDEFRFVRASIMQKDAAA